MDRKIFLNRFSKFLIGLAGGTALIGGSSKLISASNDSTDIKLNLNNDMEKTLSHLPDNEVSTMNTVLHKAETRGHANHGWLETFHSFSFANYFNRNRMNFGALRVLNDDIIAEGRGFGEHPHDNMEIITIPLEGDLAHKDSMGNTEIIRHGEIQVMSAGSGITHSEFNANSDSKVKLLQIWVYPNTRNVKPRYDQISLKNLHKRNEFVQILSPNKDDDGVWIYQNAWFYLAEFDSENPVTFKLNDSQNGVYIFVIEGQIKVGNQILNHRDGFGIWNVESIDMQTYKGSRILLMEVPMNF